MDVEMDFDPSVCEVESWGGIIVVVVVFF